MDDILSALNKIVADVKIGKESLQDAVLSKTKVENAIRFAKTSLETANKTQSDSAFIAARDFALENAKLIYAEQVRDATSIATEYAFDSFLQPLLRVGDNKELYKFTQIGSGWGRSISVELDMDTVAGTIEDYAQAVESVREEFGVKDGRDPDLASKIWRQKIYGKGPYYKTIKARLSASTEAAPFWSLLNYGNKNVSMSSDIGGSPYPSRGGHHFVEKSESAIKELFLTEFRKLKLKYDADVTIVRDAISDADILLDQLQIRIDTLSRESELIAKMAKEIDVSASKLDASKILKAVERIRNGDIFTTQVVVGAGVRVRTKKFIEITSGFGE